MLGRPARALNGPYSLRRLYTGLGTPSLLRQINIQAHSLEVSKKEVTSVSDSGYGQEPSLEQNTERCFTQVGSSLTNKH